MGIVSSRSCAGCVAGTLRAATVAALRPAKHPLHGQAHEVACYIAPLAFNAVRCYTGGNVRSAFSARIAQRNPTMRRLVLLLCAISLVCLPLSTLHATPDSGKQEHDRLQDAEATASSRQEGQGPDRRRRTRRRPRPRRAKKPPPQRGRPRKPSPPRSRPRSPSSFSSPSRANIPKGRPRRECSASCSLRWPR